MSSIVVELACTLSIYPFSPRKFSGQKVHFLLSTCLFFTCLLSKPMSDEMAAIPRMIYGTAWKKVLGLDYALAPISQSHADQMPSLALIWL